MTQTMDDLVLGVGADTTDVDRAFGRATAAVDRFAADTGRALTSIPAPKVDTSDLLARIHQTNAVIRSLRGEAATLAQLPAPQMNVTPVTDDLKQLGVEAEASRAAVAAVGAGAAKVGGALDAAAGETQTLVERSRQLEAALRKMGLAEEAIQTSLARSGLLTTEAARATDALAAARGRASAVPPPSPVAPSGPTPSGPVGPAMPPGASPADPTTFRELAQALKLLQAEFKAGLVDVAQYQAGLVGIRDQTVALRAQVGELAGGELSAFNSLSSQVGANALKVGTAFQQLDRDVARAGQDAFATIDQALAHATQEFQAGVLSVEDYRFALEEARQSLVNLRSQGVEPAGERLVTIHRSLERLGKQSSKLPQGIAQAKSALVTLAAQSVQSTSALGQLGAGLLLFGAGGAAVIGFAAGLIVVGKALDNITGKQQKAKETAEEHRKALKQLLEQRRDPLDVVQEQTQTGTADVNQLIADLRRAQAEVTRLQQSVTTGNLNAVAPLEIEKQRVIALSEKLAESEKTRSGGVVTVNKILAEQEQARAERLRDLIDLGIQETAEVERGRAVAAKARAELARTTGTDDKSQQRRLELAAILQLLDAESDLTRARREASRQEIELSRQRTSLDREAAEFANAAQLDRGLIGFRQFFDERRAIVTDAVAADIAALLQERALIEQQVALTPEARVKKETDLKANDGRIEQVQLRAHQQQRALDEEERRDALAFANERIQIEQQIQAAQGQTHAAAMLALDQEARAMSLALAKQGVAPTEVADRVQALREARAAQAEVEETARRAQGVVDEIARARSVIEAQVAAGLLTEAAGQERIAAIERDRLPTLRALAEAMLAVALASDNPELVEQAAALATQVKVLALASSRASQQAAKLSRTLGVIVAGARGVVQTASAVGLIGEEAERALASVVDLGGALQGLSAPGLDFASMLTGGFDAVGAFMGIAEGLFGESAGERAMREAQIANTEALEALKLELSGFQIDGIGDQARVGQAAARIASNPELMGDIRDAMKFRLPGDPAPDQLINEFLAGTGVTFAQLNAEAQKLGITFFTDGKLVEGSFSALAETLGIAVEALTRFANSFDEQLTKEQIKDDLFGASSTDAATARMENELDAIATVAPELAKRFAGIDLDTEEGKQAFERELKRIEAEMEAGTLDPTLLGGLNHDQFIQFIADGAGYVSDFNDAVQGATDSMLNVPQVFKQAGFAGDAADPVTPATDPTGPTETFRPIFEPGRLPGDGATVEDFLASLGQARSQTVTVEAGAIVVQGADQDPDTIAEAVLDRLRQRAMSVFGTTDNWGQQ